MHITGESGSGRNMKWGYGKNLLVSRVNFGRAYDTEGTSLTENARSELSSRMASIKPW
jgi:hypothetical protein